jgi:AraC family transcriptional activator FtrA
MSVPDRRRVAVLAYEGLGTFEFGIVVELFGLRRKNLPVKWYDFEVCSLERGPIRATGGIRIEASAGLRSLRKAGTIVIPGWRDADEIPPEPLLRALRSAHAAGARLVSICSGVFVLAATGLLDGKRASTHWRYANRLASRYPQIRVEPDVLYVDEGRILTSAGSAAGIDLCLHIVRLDYGAEIANEIARRLVMPPHREGGQAQYVRDPIRSAAAGGLAPVLAWAQSHLNQSLRVEDLARKAAMSPRTFARRFSDQTGTTPHQWLIHQRLLEAQRLLESTTESMDQVAQAVGLQTAATLRSHFARVLKTTPTAYRRQFSTRRVGGKKQPGALTNVSTVAAHPTARSSRSRSLRGRVVVR